MTIVLMSGYALMGFAIFGPSLEQFSTITSTYICLLSMMLGDIIFWELFETTPAIAVIYFITFMTLFFLILSNMLIAIIMTTY
mmetsp:Transcript_3933/g.2323  ORF Transcript_3933/g.2323 Transcript_3933/m.2323 type:complete len:83 (-) Transcript_3933:466-714(-)